MFLKLKQEAAYITTEGRLKLCNYLEKFGESALYCDAEYVIYIQKVGEDPKSQLDIIWVLSLMY
jgi:hypothetical protein